MGSVDDILTTAWITEYVPVDEVVLCEVLHAAGHLDGDVGHVPEVQDPLGLPGPGHRHRQVGLGAVGQQVLVQVTLRRALKYQAPAQLGGKL
jgi:hypothetical protein